MNKYSVNRVSNYNFFESLSSTIIDCETLIIKCDHQSFKFPRVDSGIVDKICNKRNPIRSTSKPFQMVVFNNYVLVWDILVYILNGGRI